MMDEPSGTLKDLQNLDLEIEAIRIRITEIESLLAEVEEPALALEKEVVTHRKRLQEMQVEERRLERAADDRRARNKVLRERLKSVRNLREEAAVQAEMDLQQRALEGEEQEALSLLDQIRKLEDRIRETEGAIASARSEVDPRRDELMADQDRTQSQLSTLESRRASFAAGVSGDELQSYERIRGGGRSVAVTALTGDGACGHCFGMIPLQVQNEIRTGKALIPCEFCGVLLGPEEQIGKG